MGWAARSREPSADVPAPHHLIWRRTRTARQEVLRRAAQSAVHADAAWNAASAVSATLTRNRVARCPRSRAAVRRDGHAVRGRHSATRDHDDDVFVEAQAGNMCEPGLGRSALWSYCCCPPPPDVRPFVGPIAPTRSCASQRVGPSCSTRQSPSSRQAQMVSTHLHSDCACCPDTRDWSGSAAGKSGRVCETWWMSKRSRYRAHTDDLCVVTAVRIQSSWR